MPQLATFNGSLYFGFGLIDAATNVKSGIQVWRNADGTTWKKDFQSSDPFHVIAMQVFNGCLYVAKYDGLKAWGGVFRTDGTSGKWDEIHVPNMPGTIGSLAVYHGKLYAGYLGPFGPMGVGKPLLYSSSDGVNWSPVSGGPVGNGHAAGVTSMTVWDGQLYVGTWDYASGGQIFKVTDNLSP